MNCVAPETYGVVLWLLNGKVKKEELASLLTAVENKCIEHDNVLSFGVRMGGTDNGVYK